MKAVPVKNPGVRILNLTQHVATPEQRVAGVEEPPAEVKKEIQQLLTFDNIEDTKEAGKRAEELVRVAKALKYEAVMVEGAPFLMPFLVRIALDQGLRVFFAFSKRVSVEERQGEMVVKKTIFRHEGFIELVPSILAEIMGVIE